VRNGDHAASITLLSGELEPPATARLHGLSESMCQYAFKHRPFACGLNAIHGFFSFDSPNNMDSRSKAVVLYHP
jgi:hypothetical protein